MFSQFLRGLVLATGVSALAVPAAAATMTFSSLVGYPFTKTYTEAGITADVIGYGYLGVEPGSGGLHFDDAGTSAQSSVGFSMATNFDAVSFLLDPVGFDLVVCTTEGGCAEPTYSNVFVQGYRNGNLVSNMLFDMGASLDPYLVTLGASFTNLTSLLISVIYPNVAQFRSTPGVTGVYPCAPCSHFNVDNVTLAPVPLPAGLPLAASGLGILLLVSRRRRAV